MAARSGRYTKLTHYGQLYGEKGWRPRDFGRVEVWGCDLSYKIVCSAFMRTHLPVVRIGPSGG
jgi:hypothetical protein